MANAKTNCLLNQLGGGRRGIVWMVFSRPDWLWQNIRLDYQVFIFNGSAERLVMKG
jgi:hypothetical protein